MTVILLIFRVAKGSGLFAAKGLIRPHGTKIPLAVRRRVAVSLLETGWGVRQVARHGQASTRVISEDKTA
jgi:hypothetical protein